MQAPRGRARRSQSKSGGSTARRHIIIGDKHDARRRNDGGGGPRATRAARARICAREAHAQAPPRTSRPPRAATSSAIQSVERNIFWHCVIPAERRSAERWDAHVDLAVTASQSERACPDAHSREHTALGRDARVAEKMAETLLRQRALVGALPSETSCVRAILRAVCATKQILSYSSDKAGQRGLGQNHGNPNCRQGPVSGTWSWPGVPILGFMIRAEELMCHFK